MATGIVTTARGKPLNIDELIQQAQRPIGYKDAASTRENPNYTPAADNTPKVRGFVPAAGESTPPILDDAEAARENAQAKEAKPQGRGAKKTLAEHTKVTVKKTAKKPTTAKKEAEEVQEEDEVLGDILNEMENDE